MALKKVGKLAKKKYLLAEKASKGGKLEQKKVMEHQL